MTKDEVIKAWTQMGEIVDRNRDLFDTMQSPSIHSQEEYEQWAERLETFLKKDLTAVQAILEKAQDQGKTRNDLNTAWTKLVGSDAPFEGNRSVEALLMNLEDGLKYVETGRADIASSLVQESEVELKNVSSYAEAVRPDIFKRNRQRLQVAKRFDPNNQGVIDWLANIDELEKKTNAAAEKAMNDFVFPAHVSGFSGPGKPDELAKAALDYFNSTCKPNEKAVRAAVFDKDWYCFKRNLFGQPTVWALTFMVAVQLDEEKDKDITRVWNISFLTEENPGVAKAPPFARAAFNQSYKMRTSKLK